MDDEDFKGLERRVAKLEVRMETLVSQNASEISSLNRLQEQMECMDVTLRGEDGRNGLVSKINRLYADADRRWQMQLAVGGAALALAADLILNVLQLVR